MSSTSNSSSASSAMLIQLPADRDFSMAPYANRAKQWPALHGASDTEQHMHMHKRMARASVLHCVYAQAALAALLIKTTLRGKSKAEPTGQRTALHSAVRAMTRV